MPFPVPHLLGILIATALAFIVPLYLQRDEPHESVEATVLDRVQPDEVHRYLREVGVIDDESKIISTEWNDTLNQWLVITEQGKHEDGNPRFGHWFVDANGKNWSGSFCRN